MSTEQALQRIESEVPATTVEADNGIIRAPITPAQAKIDAVANLTMKAYERASTLVLTPEEIAALQADFPDEAFQPGAAGKEHLIYIEHAHLRDRLNQVFGPGQWAIIPRSRWAEDFTTEKGQQASRVYVEAMLCIRGCFVAEAIGDMVYYRNNASQNYGDAVEGAKTAALRRCAKELGIGLQAWKKEFGEGWWQRRRSGKRPQNAPETRTAASGAKAPATGKPGAKQAAPAVPKEATEDQKARFIKTLLPLGQAALDFAYDKGWLLPPGGDFPGEPLECISLVHVPTTQKQFQAIMDEIRQRMDNVPQSDKTQSKPENQQLASQPKGNGDRGARDPKATSGTPGTGEPAPASPRDDEWWWDVIVPIPHKGQKRAEYMRAPETIGQLYDLRHDNDEARRRLFGFAQNFEAKGWAKRDGTQMPASNADVKFREALDAFWDWFEEHHPDEAGD